MYTLENAENEIFAELDVEPLECALKELDVSGKRLKRAIPSGNGEFEGAAADFMLKLEALYGAAHQLFIESQSPLLEYGLDDLVNRRIYETKPQTKTFRGSR